MKSKLIPFYCRLLPAAIGLLAGTAAFGQTYPPWYNGALITINDNTTATPYPSSITVSNVTGVVSRVVVTLFGLSHTYPGDLDVLLVGPGGQSVVLMSDAGTSIDVANIDLTFKDDAPTTVPDNAILVDGSYRPTNLGADDAFPAPAPATNHGTALSALNQTIPNGTWRLFVVDDAGSDTGSLAAGWGFTLTTGPVPLRVNEWLARNSNNLADPADGQFEGWFELYNFGTNALDLSGFHLSDDLNNPAKFKIPNGTTLDAKGHLLVWADGETNQTSGTNLHANFKLPAEGGSIAVWQGGALIDSVTFGGQKQNVSQGRWPDGAATLYTMPTPTPRAANVISTTTLVTLTNVWRYDASGADLGTDWKEPAYDDSLWASGRALFYNPAGSWPAPTNTFLPLTNASGQRLITHYFRGYFTNECPPESVTLRVSYVLDDGAVIHLNGDEIRRVRLAAGAVSNSTLASTIVTAVLEGPANVPADSLIPGVNVLAVELHQASPASPDAAFALALTASNALPLVITQPPMSQTVTSGTPYVFLTAAVSGPAPLRYQWLLNGAAMPGQTNATLVLSNVQPATGGTYCLYTVGGGFTLASPPACLSVTTSNSFHFDDSPGIPPAVPADLTGTIVSNNAAATRQVDEPLHGGKPGSNSLWFTWRAPATGIATFSTRGSSFDTLLAAYTGGPSMTSLTNVAGDDDRGGFLTSQIKFNVTNGVIYRVAVDGFYGATGKVVLAWQLESGFDVTKPAPEIINTPTNRAVLRGSNTAFRVTALHTNRFQWHFNGAAIANATNSSYTVSNVQPANVGAYTVRLPYGTNAQNQFIETAPAILEIGSFPAVVSRDKREELRANPPPTNGLVAASLRAVPVLPSSDGTGAFLSPASITVAQGSMDTRIMDNSISTIECGEFICEQSAFATRWLNLDTTVAGLTWIFDTKDASGNPTARFEVNHANVTGTGDDQFCPVGNEVRIPAIPVLQGGPYTIHLDRTNESLGGQIYLNWRLGSNAVFRTQPLAKTVFSNATQTTRFSCLATGLPPPFYQWHFQSGGVWLPIPGASGTTHTNLDVLPTGSSNFVVTASNFMKLTVSSPAQLTVLAVSDPTNLTILAGGTATFTVDVNPKPTAGQLGYQWFEGNTSLSLQTEPTLTLSNVPTNINGRLYKVHVTYGGSTYTSKVARLTVHAPVTNLTVTLPNPGVCLGSVATLQAAAAGNPLPQFWWMLGNQLITNGPALMVSATNPGAQTYTLFASNCPVTGGCRVLSSNVTLTVTSPPSILQLQASSLTVTQDANVTFSVTASGTPPLTYQWRSNSVNLANSSTVSGATTANLTLSHVTTNHTAAYDVRVANACGALFSAPLMLTVCAPPQITIGPTNNFATNRGSTVTFTASATGFPAPTGFQWFFNGSTPLTTEPTLTLSNVQPNQAGPYTIAATNCAGSTTVTAMLQVYTLPYFTNQPVSRSAPVGADVTFTAGAAGDPPPEYKWLPAQGATAASLSTSNSFTISNVQLAHAGTYFVIATNQYGGTNSATFTLSVGTSFRIEYRLQTNQASQTLDLLLCMTPPAGVLSNTFVLEASDDPAKPNWTRIWTNDMPAPPNQPAEYRIPAITNLLPAFPNFGSNFFRVRPWPP